MFWQRKALEYKKVISPLYRVSDRGGTEEERERERERGGTERRSSEQMPPNAHNL